MSTHKPINRAEFKALCLRRLGDGAIVINVTDDHVEDCIEEALKYFRDYHYDGSAHTYFTYQMTSDDITNRYITVPEELFGVVTVYDLKTRGLMTSASAGNFFSFDYQFAMNASYQLESGSFLSYYVNKVAYDTFAQLLGNQNPIRFNRHQNRVYIDVEWERYAVGDYIVFDGYQAVDPDQYTDVWSDRWLIKYCTAKIKYIWGSILSKYQGTPLPSGVTLDGTKIQDDAYAEIQALEDEMMTSYSIPPRDLIM